MYNGTTFENNSRKKSRESANLQILSIFILCYFPVA